MDPDTQTDLEQIAPGLPNASVPLPRIATAGQPRAEHLPRLADAGYRTVLDLRGADEERGFDEAEETRRAGMEYLSLPVTGRPEDATFDRFRTILRDGANQPLVVHCGSASRVGGMMIPHLMLDRGQGREEALRTAEAIGLRSPELTQAALEYVERTGSNDHHRGGIMPDVSAQAFIDALHRLEADRDAGPIAGMYTGDADISNPVVPHQHQGPDGAREFWTAYRNTFREIRSEFHHVLEGDGAAMLEWTSTGTSADGSPFRYRGVSVLEFGEGGIHAFRAYFDSRELGKQLTHREGSGGQ